MRALDSMKVFLAKTYKEARTMRYAILLTLTAVFAGGEAISFVVNPPSIDPRDLQGTWQIMSIKNLETGEVDEIAKRRTIWFQVTERHWTYIWMDLDRDVVKPKELAELSEDDQIKTNYTKIWNHENEPRFWASGGTYKVEDNKFVYTDLLSIEPHMIGHTGVEEIVRLDRTTYIYHAMPDEKGVVRAYWHRRLD